MLQHPPNWVAELAERRIDLQFEALCQVIERDVAEVNKLSPDLRGGLTFSAYRNDEGTRPLLRVYRSDEGASNSSTKAVATFMQSQAGIHVTTESGMFLARPEWVALTRSCLLSVEGNHYKVWELSQKILSPLFFEKAP